MTTPHELAEAYRQCLYGVKIPAGTMVLRVGRRSAELDSLLRDLEQSAGAVISAANPLSRRLSAEENAVRHESLCARLPAGHRVMPTVARDPHGSWPDEVGFLVLGVTQQGAVELARAFEQHAILWCETGEPVRLLWASALAPPAAEHLDQQGACGSDKT